MKISLNTIHSLNKRYHCAEDFTLSVDQLVEKVGTQLGAVDEVVEFGKKYEGIIIARVVSCEKHPNADKLSVCLIDDGGKAQQVERNQDGQVQVVCGASNVRAGLNVAWLPPGATVPATAGKEPFILESRELRGVVSNGMLASAKELALGDDHEGILEIDGDHVPGSDFAEAFNLKDDVVLDIENKMFTHRPDCFGFLGVARELAGIQAMPYKSPDWYTPTPDFPTGGAENLPLSVENELPSLVPRFTAIPMANVKVGPSPVWLQIELAKAGLKSINNIVDYTNFFMLETGQPLHAYDYDKVKAVSGGEPKLAIRNPRSGEKVKLLGGKEIEPRAEAIMIATDRQLIGLGGVMGGAETEVDAGTRNIILECANFDMYSVRRTSMAHGLFTDAVTRFTKGQSPLQCLAVLAKIVDEIQGYAGGQVAGTPIDDNHLDEATLSRQSLHPPVKVTAAFVNVRLSLKLSAEEMKKLLENVEFKVETAGDELTVTAPFWRTDIELREDIVEEVGRLHGYDKLPLQLPRRDLTPAAKDPLLELKDRIRTRLARAGANEVLTYSFVHGDLLDRIGQDKTKAFQVANALSPDLQYYRVSLLPSLLEKVHPNIKAGYDEFALFELGKAHNADNMDKNGLPLEFENLALVYTARKSTKAGAAYYEARRFLTELADGFGHSLTFVPLNEHFHYLDSPFEPSRSAMVQLKRKEGFGIVGEFKSSVRKQLKLPGKTAGFELGIGAFVETEQVLKKYMALSRFPKVTQDITLKVPAKHFYRDVQVVLSGQLSYSKPAGTFTKLEPIDIFQKDNNPDHKHFTFRLTITSYERTLTDREVNKLLDTVAAAARAKFGAERS